MLSCLGTSFAKTTNSRHKKGSLQAVEPKHPSLTCMHCLCQNLELLAVVRARLLKDKVMAVPRVHIHASNGPRVAELQRIVQGLKGELLGPQGEV